MTRDADYVYFYVETAANITSYSGASWMRLLINKDMSWRSGWKGYDYCLNLETPQSSTVGYVSECTSTTSEWSWTRLQTFDYRVAGNKMELRIPRNLFPSGFNWVEICAGTGSSHNYRPVRSESAQGTENEQQNSPVTKNAYSVRTETAGSTRAMKRVGISRSSMMATKATASAARIQGRSRWTGTKDTK